MNVHDQDWWPEDSMLAKLATVDYCAYGYSYRKSTDVWTSLMDWSPRGRTGSGRCEQSCGQGHWHLLDSGRITFRHHINLAQHPRDGIRGEGAAKQLNSLPPELVMEILTAALCEWPRRFEDDPRSPEFTPDPPVLIDLCSGYGSLEAVAHQLGMVYVAVDLVDKRPQLPSQ